LQQRKVLQVSLIEKQAARGEGAGITISRETFDGMSQEIESLKERRKEIEEKIASTEATLSEVEQLFEESKTKLSKTTKEYEETKVDPFSFHFSFPQNPHLSFFFFLSLCSFADDAGQDLPRTHTNA
jgi:post-segregation antitoxin (ccd killing protein)